MDNFVSVFELLTGTRMWRRGANLQGDTANFIETEQLMEFDGFISSFLQVLLCQSMVGFMVYYVKVWLFFLQMYGDKYLLVHVKLTNSNKHINQP